MVITLKGENRASIKHENKSTIARLESLHEQFLVRKVYALQTKMAKLEKDGKEKDAEIKMLCKQLEYYHTKQHIAEQEKLKQEIDVLQTQCCVLKEDVRNERAITAQLHAEYQLIMANCLLSSKHARITSYGQKKQLIMHDKATQCNIMKKRQIASNWLSKFHFTKLLLMSAFYCLILFFIFIQVFIFGTNTPWDMKFADEPLIM